MYLSFLKHSKEHINICVGRKTCKQYESIKKKTKVNSNSPPKLDISKCFYENIPVFPKTLKRTHQCMCEKKDIKKNMNQ